MSRPRKTDRHLPQCFYLVHGAYYHVKKGKRQHLGRDLQDALQMYGRILAAQSTTCSKMDRFIDEGFELLIKTKDEPLAPKSIRNYRTAVKQLKEALRAHTPQSLMTKHVRMLKKMMYDRKISFNIMLTVLRQIYDQAIELDELEFNPCLGVEAYSMSGRTRELLPEQYFHIRDHASPQLACMMNMSYLTGQRVMSVVGIKLKNLREDGIFFPAFKTRFDDVKVEWTPELRAEVEIALKIHGDTLHPKATTLFHSKRGKALQYRYVNQLWLKASRAAGFGEDDGEDYTQMRDLRAMSATAVKAQGGNAQTLLGHTSPKTTENYLRDKSSPLVQGPSFTQLCKTSKTKTKQNKDLSAVS